MGSIMNFAPYMLEKAAQFKDPIYRFKQGFLFKLTNMLNCVIMLKNFNPILGETCQALIDGCPYYAEQISHHPPMSYYNFIGRGYKIHGYINSVLKFGFNYAAGNAQDLNVITF